MVKVMHVYLKIFVTDQFTFWLDIEGKISAIAAAEVVVTENTKEKEQVVLCV